MDCLIPDLHSPVRAAGQLLYHQVKSYTQIIEKRLIKQNRVDEFNAQFKDTVDRGVFSELTQKDLEDWKGPFNYIAMVEALKNGPHATTSLMICMNSSLLQLPPIKKSLNEPLMKGPPALLDLFTVSLSFREHRFAATKDLSCFTRGSAHEARFVERLCHLHGF